MFGYEGEYCGGRDVTLRGQYFRAALGLGLILGADRANVSSQARARHARALLRLYLGQRVITNG
jgi:hypothetical protein